MKNFYLSLRQGLLTMELKFQFLSDDDACTTWEHSD